MKQTIIEFIINKKWYIIHLIMWIIISILLYIEDKKAKKILKDTELEYEIGRKNKVIPCNKIWELSGMDHHTTNIKTICRREEVVY